jgi:hypothetical protein
MLNVLHDILMGAAYITGTLALIAGALFMFGLLIALGKHK